MVFNMVYVVSERPAVGLSGPIVDLGRLRRLPSPIADWPCTPAGGNGDGGSQFKFSLHTSLSRLRPFCHIPRCFFFVTSSPRHLRFLETFVASNPSSSLILRRLETSVASSFEVLGSVRDFERIEVLGSLRDLRGIEVLESAQDFRRYEVLVAFEILEGSENSEACEISESSRYSVACEFFREFEVPGSARDISRVRGTRRRAIFSIGSRFSEACGVFQRTKVRGSVRGF